MSETQPPAPTWEILLQELHVLEVLQDQSLSVGKLHAHLHALETEATNTEAAHLLHLLTAIASLYVKVDDWDVGYGPLLSFPDGRSFLPEDLNDDDLATLRAIASDVPNHLLRARIFDVLSLRAEREERFKFVGEYLNATTKASVSAETWPSEHRSWARAVETARRFGPPTQQQLNTLESQLLGGLMARASDGFFQFGIADLLLQQKLGVGQERAIAERLVSLGESSSDEPDKYRAYFESASAWFEKAGDTSARDSYRAAVVKSYSDEAADEANLESGHPLRSAALLEDALKVFRTIPRASREQLGISSLESELAERIRIAGSSSINLLHRFETDPIDLSDSVAEARSRVTGKAQADALRNFCLLSPFASFEQDCQDATELTEKHPFTSLMPQVNLSADGRIIGRSFGLGGEPIHGVDPAVWHQMVQTHLIRMRLLAQGAIWPAYVVFSNEHHLTIADLLRVVEGAQVIPPEHCAQFARGLYHGFTGDFSSATQLLTPQLEHLIRTHLRAAGVSTTRMENGIEEEVGLSRLLDRERVEEIFGVDLVYEIRVLFTDQFGPNLRNTIAHGLLSDTESVSEYTLYAWWFCLRLVYLQFRARMGNTHDNASATTQSSS